MSVTTVVLAAGQGARLGGPKALLAWPGSAGRRQPLALAHVEERRAAESEAVLVVVRPTVARVLAQWPRPPAVQIIESRAAEQLGPAGSIAVATRWLREHASGQSAAERDLVLLTPVDLPPASPTTVEALLTALRASPDPLAARPRCGARRGHPVALRPSVLADYLDGTPPPLRRLLHELGDRAVDVAVDDPAVLADLDSPAALRAWAQSDPRAPRQPQFISGGPR